MVLLHGFIEKTQTPPEPELGGTCTWNWREIWKTTTDGQTKDQTGAPGHVSGRIAA